MDSDIVDDDVDVEGKELLATFASMFENVTVTEVTTAVMEIITETTVFKNSTLDYTPVAVVENHTEFVDVMTTATEDTIVSNSTFVKTLAAIATINTTTMVATTEEELSVEELQQSIDTFFIFINSLLIFFLQGGFALLEAGSVRSKNTTNILIKNLLDILLACVAFWTFGYMFAYSQGNSFIGTDVT